MPGPLQADKEGGTVVVDDLRFEIQEEEAQVRPRIKVIGVGGAGSNAVAHMMDCGLEGVEFHVLNTDVLALKASPVPNKLAIGLKITNGQGAGGDPEIGRQAALEDTARIVEIMAGGDIVFVAAGLGSGTGTGASPVVASLARELSALTVAIVTRPFSFEGLRPAEQAAHGLTELAGSADAVIAVPNDRLLTLAPRGTSLLEAFRMANDILRQAVGEIVEIITTPGLINRDFADIRATMRGMGVTLMGTAMARGENAALEAARQAISCPLVEDARMSGARNILIQVTGSSRLGLHELNEACALIREAAQCEEARVTFGVVLNESMADAVKVTVIAAGFSQPAAAPAFAAPPARVPEPEPEPELVGFTVGAGSPSDDDADDLETPPYLQHRRLVQ